MARLALQVGGAIAGAIIFQNPALGFAIGAMVGGIAGSVLFPPEVEDSSGPRNQDLNIQRSSYGHPITKIYGTDRSPNPEMLWTSGVQHYSVETEVSGKGAPTASGPPIDVYRASFDIGICAANSNAKLLAIWADSKLIVNMTSSNTKIAKPFGLNYRFYPGSETQSADPTEEAHEGTGEVPAYRDWCRIVFEDMNLTPYGGRYPNLNFLVSMNPTNPFPTVFFDSPVSIWSSDTFRFDPTFTFLYGAVLGYFTIINALNNTYLLEDRYEPTLQSYDMATDVGLEGEWFSTEEAGTNESNVIKIDQFVGSWDRVIDPSTGLAIKYTAVSTGQLKVWRNGHLLWLITGLYGLIFVIDYKSMLPLHPVNVVGGIPYAGITEATLDLADPMACQHAVVDESTGEIWIVSSDYWAALDDTWLVHGSQTFETEDISAYIERGIYIGLEPDNGWLFIGSNKGGAAKVIIWDIATNSYVKTISYNGSTDICTGSRSGFQGIVNHRLWIKTYGALSTVLEIDTLSGEVLRSIDIVTDFGVAVGGSLVYDPYSHALWTQSNVPAGWWKLILDRADPQKILLSTIVDDICNQADLADSEIDVTELTDLVWGYHIDQRMSARNAIEPLQLAYFFDGVESDGDIKFLKRELRTSVVTIPETELSCHDPGGQRPEPLLTTRQQELELPKVFEVIYIDPNRDYQQGTQRSQRQIVYTKEKKTVTLPIVLEADDAKAISEILHYLMWLERNRYKFITYKKYAYLDNCDALTLTVNSKDYLMRLTKMEHGMQGLLACEAVPHDTLLFGLTATGATGEWVAPTEITYPGPTTMFIMDMPFIRDSDQGYNPTGFYVAMSRNAGGWAGALLYKSIDTASWQEIMTAMNSATQGIINSGTLVEVHDPNVWDTTSSINVQLFDNTATLSSATDEEVYAGANAAVISSSPLYPYPEIIQFANATLVTSNPKVYTLSRLLRGRRGTEYAITNHGTNDRFILLTNTTIYRAPMESNEAGSVRYYKALSIGEPWNIVIPSYTATYASGLKPLSAVHINGSRNDANDLTITWIPRTRIGGTWRSGVAPGLVESSAEYELDIYDETMSTTLRQVTGLTSPTYTYTAAMQTTDGITPGDLVTVYVYQKSGIIGRGYPANTIV